MPEPQSGAGDPPASTHDVALALRRELAVRAAEVAATEDEVAATFDALADTHPDRAAALRREAVRAREYAEVERRRSAHYANEPYGEPPDSADGRRDR